jgi:hypothetical protein
MGKLVVGLFWNPPKRNHDGRDTRSGSMAAPPGKEGLQGSSAFEIIDDALKINEYVMDGIRRCAED